MLYLHLITRFSGERLTASNSLIGSVLERNRRAGFARTHRPSLLFHLPGQLGRPVKRLDLEILNDGISLLGKTMGGTTREAIGKEQNKKRMSSRVITVSANFQVFKNPPSRRPGKGGRV